ncbi:LytR cell envelope-related transcriptional attenuator [Prauserella marina]|uniref:LytR cell envelope-related transcriptional attenuator n=1 Tax=Prauserella marina TaxID=530584 RepID=A0A1G6J899_9PSEU|nr:envelope integrity protein Cei [Prauserella marina]PWV84717.1 LytR cell envelope-related transcriptional attenuator [Prauserella marina]SDC14950.1 LytR cell envelope-related transcriptional attenuator [Prauserella marina]
MSGSGGSAGSAGYGVSGVPGGPGAAARAGGKAKPYRKRKPLPALIVIALLGVVAVFVWVKAIATNENIDEAIRCTPAATPPEGVTYAPQPYDALAGSQPTPPDRIALRVLNASGTRGQAAITTEGLRQLGFTQIAEPENDPAYPDEKATASCHGQIRYGENGAAAARTIQLIDPCLQLVKDNRQDATVDLAVGTSFNDVRPLPAGMDILKKLNAWSAEHKGTGNGEQSSSGRGPVIEEELLADAEPSHC